MKFPTEWTSKIHVPNNQPANLDWEYDIMAMSDNRRNTIDTMKKCSYSVIPLSNDDDSNHTCNLGVLR